jgi:hypothetical protein
MGNNRHLVENLVLVCTAQKVGGISKGLTIQGKGTLVLTINDDTGKPHRVHIPKSLYLPGLRMCLLSPQHWAQEARDNYPLPNGTRMENNANNCVLFWEQGKFSKTIPFNAATNTPIFHTSPLTSSYHAFVNTFQVLEAPFFAHERVFQVPGHCWLDGAPSPSKEFVAEENINYHKDMTVSEGDVCEDDKTLLTSNLPPPPKLDAHPDITRCNALIFNPSPPLEEEDEYSVTAPDDQAEWMRWHYCLGHVPFSKLKRLATNGGIQQRLASVCPPHCASCLFGAMTNIPWKTKASSNNGNSVFAATKLGECVSVNHMQSTEPGFYGQAKGALAKTPCKNVTVFVDHCLHLQFVYFMTSNLTLLETLNAKSAFKCFAIDHSMQIKHYHCNNG